MELGWPLAVGLLAFFGIGIGGLPIAVEVLE